MALDREVDRALIVVAHPDDVDFWAGGTVASWTSAGIAVAYLVVTDGDSGGFDPRIPRSAIPDIRRDEQFFQFLPDFVIDFVPVEQAHRLPEPAFTGTLQCFLEDINGTVPPGVSLISIEHNGGNLLPETPMIAIALGRKV